MLTGFIFYCRFFRRPTVAVWRSVGGVVLRFGAGLRRFLASIGGPLRWRAIFWRGLRATSRNRKTTSRNHNQ